MRPVGLVSTVCVLAAACRGEPRARSDAPAAAPPDPPRDAAQAADVAASASGALPPHQAYPDLAAALAATIPADARVVGIGELHARVDRAPVRSSLAAFTEALPSLGDRISDLVVETWIVDPKCGQAAVTATRKVETAVKRPAATRSELGQLADAARAAGIQLHAMKLSCTDYATIAPAGGSADPVAMLTLVTRELTRIAGSAIAYRDRRRGGRPWIAVYGGALHNDRFPADGVAEWSYAAAIDRTSRDRFIELDLIVPELALADTTSRSQPWFPLAATASQVLVWQRGERSFVILLPRRSAPARE